MAKQVLSDLDFVNAARITNLPNAVSPQEPATFAQLNAAVEGLPQKDNVRVRTSSNINLAATGATVDGVALAVNDRVLVAGQTTSTENGVYVWNGAAVPMTRSLDANTGAELVNALVPVDEGTSAGTVWRQTAINITIGSTNILFVQFGTGSAAASETSAGIAELATQGEVDAGTDDLRIITPLKLANHSNRKRKLSQQIGDAAATQYTITHNFNTYDVQVEVYRNSGNRDTILCDVDRTSLNAVRLTFATAPALNAYSAVLLA